MNEITHVEIVTKFEMIPFIDFNLQLSKYHQRNEIFDSHSFEVNEAFVKKYVECGFEPPTLYRKYKF